MTLSKYFVAALFSTLSLSIHSAPIDPLTISGASGCGITSTDCTVDWYSQIYTPELAAVQINRSTGSSWLIRYNLHAPSTLSSTTFDYDTAYGTSVTSYTGNIWLEAPSEIGLTNNFNIFTDQVDQVLDSNQGRGLPTFHLGMTAADVLNGTASYYDSGEPNDTGTGNLIVNDPYIVCIECSLNLTLNLNGLYYSSGQLLINPIFLDPQTQLLTYDNSHSFEYGDLGYSNKREFYVASVPVPAAFWLFASGLLTLFNFAGHRRKS